MREKMEVLFIEEALERVGDKEIYKEIADYFIAIADTSIVTLEANIGERNADESTRLAHSLKSNCATLGAEKAKDICAELEILCRNAQFEEAERKLPLLTSALAEVKKALQNLSF